MHDSFLKKWPPFFSAVKSINALLGYTDLHGMAEKLFFCTAPNTHLAQSHRLREILNTLSRTVNLKTKNPLFLQTQTRPRWWGQPSTIEELTGGIMAKLWVMGVPRGGKQDTTKNKPPVLLPFVWFLMSHYRNEILNNFFKVMVLSSFI